MPMQQGAMGQAGMGVHPIMQLMQLFHLFSQMGMGQQMGQGGMPQGNMPLQSPMKTPGMGPSTPQQRSSLPGMRNTGTVNQNIQGPAGVNQGPAGNPFGMYGAMYGGRGQ